MEFLAAATLARPGPFVVGVKADFVVPEAALENAVVVDLDANDVRGVGDAARIRYGSAGDGGFPRAKTASHARDDPGASGHRSASLSRPRRSVSARPILRRIDDARTPYASPGGGDGTPTGRRSVVISAVVELPAVNALLPPARASPPRSS